MDKTKLYDHLEALEGPIAGFRLQRGKNLSDIHLEAGVARLAIEIVGKDPTPFEPLRQKAEALLKSLSGVKQAQVILTAARPADKEAVEPTRQKHAGSPLPPLARYVVAVASGKGGVGKSTTAANLALAFHAQGLRTGLLDADIYGPSLPMLFGLHEKPAVDRDAKKIIPHEKYGIRLMSIGFLVPPDTKMVWRGPMVQGALQQLLRDIAWPELDILLIDMPPGTGDVQLTLSQQVALRGAIIVSTPQDLALIDARKGLAMFQKVQVPVLGILENMSSFFCPHCGKESHIFAHGGAQQEAQKLGVPFLGEIPLEMAIREGSDQGRPVLVSSPDAPAAEAYRAATAKILHILQETAPSPLAKPQIFME